MEEDKAKKINNLLERATNSITNKHQVESTKYSIRLL